MNLLRFTQDALGDNQYRVEVALEGDGPRRVAKADFTFLLTRQDETDLRWYLEDYLQWPHDPAPTMAARVERRMEELGTGLFRSIFEFGDTTRKLWYSVSEKLPMTRVEIVTTVEGATSIPWELLREPGSEAPLALLAHSFVRAHPEARRAPRTLAEAQSCWNSVEGIVPRPLRSLWTWMSRSGSELGRRMAPYPSVMPTKMSPPYAIFA